MVRSSWAAIAAGLALSAPGWPSALAEAPPTDIIYACHCDGDGALSGGARLLEIDLSDLPIIDRGEVSVTTVWDNGPTANRIDLVLLGDGYTAPEQGLFAQHAENAIQSLFAQTPLAEYAQLFNVHRVDIVSPDSGVDNDPAQGVDRDTPLKMGFWCGGTERLLCVSVSRAYAYAAYAPETEQIIAIANSDKYGGGGYRFSDIATMSGAHNQSAELALHEFGHSFGELADEYDYGGVGDYSGDEPVDANISTLNFDQLASSGAKWARWLGAQGLDGVVGAYEGAGYSRRGLFRPSRNSKMRTLGKPFNAPSVEQMIIEMYRIVDPIDDAWPSTGGVASPGQHGVQPALPGLTIEWYVDGQRIEGADAPTLDTRTIHLSPGDYELRVVVRDDTPLVRDESTRMALMTSERAWRFEAAPKAGDLDADGQVGASDLAFVLSEWGATDSPADLSADGVVDALDIAMLLSFWDALPGN